MNAETLVQVPDSTNQHSNQLAIEETPQKELQYVPKIINRFCWIPLGDNTCEINYLESFKMIHSKDNIDLEALDLKGSKVDVIEKIMKSYAKDGVLMSKKNAQDAYDLQDGWVDDSIEVAEGGTVVNSFTPKFEDFLSHTGGIESFKKSKYYEERVSLANSLKDDSKKKKSSTKGVKKSSKEHRRKAEDSLQRPSDEVKKVKKNKDEKDDAIVIEQ